MKGVVWKKYLGGQIWSRSLDLPIKNGVLVGLGLDRIGICGSKYGKRKSWHLLGTLLITFSFPFIYSPPPGYDRNEGNWTNLEMVSIFSIF